MKKGKGKRHSIVNVGVVVGAPNAVPSLSVGCLKGAVDATRINGEPNLPGEVALWRAVILQQQLDGLSSTKKIRGETYDRDAARRYLTTPSRNLSMVCDLAFVDMEALIRHCRKLFAEPRGKKDAKDN